MEITELDPPQLAHLNCVQGPDQRVDTTVTIPQIDLHATLGSISPEAARSDRRPHVWLALALTDSNRERTSPALTVANLNERLPTGTGPLLASQADTPTRLDREPD